MPLSVPGTDAKSVEKRNPEVKGRQDTWLSLCFSLERTEFNAKLSQPERPTSFRPWGSGKRAKEKRRQNAVRKGDEGIDIGNDGGYIFQNIGYLRGKPVVCILMDRPVYGAQFISKSKVMAVGLHPMVFPPPSWSSATLDRPQPSRDHIKISNKYENGRVRPGHVLPHFSVFPE